MPQPATVPQYLPLFVPPSFRRFTRVEGQVPYSANGQTNPLRIDPTGTLLGLLVTFSGTLTTGATAPILADSAPYSIVKYVSLSISGGVGQQCYVPAYILNLVERTREQDYTDAAVTPVVASTANVWTWDFHVPVCVRDGETYGGWSDLLGAVYTGDQEITVNFQLIFNSEATIITNQGAANATLAGTFTITSIKLDTPSPADNLGLLSAISWVHRLQEEKANVGITGAGVLSLDGLPVSQPKVYLRIWDSIVNNGAHANGVVATIDAQFQDMVDFEQNLPEQVWLARQRRRYIQPLPPGNYCLDFASGNTRNSWQPVDRISIFRITPTVSGVALTAATLARYSEHVVPSPLAAKWMNKAAQNGNLAKWFAQGPSAAAA
jgi:hypothetical protein